MSNSPRCYTAQQVRERLQLSRSTYYELKVKGALVMLEELKPRIGRSARYRADLVDRWLAGNFNGPKFFRKAS